MALRIIQITKTWNHGSLNCGWRQRSCDFSARDLSFQDLKDEIGPRTDVGSCKDQSCHCTRWILPPLPLHASFFSTSSRILNEHVIICVQRLSEPARVCFFPSIVHSKMHKKLKGRRISIYSGTSACFSWILTSSAILGSYCLLLLEAF